MAKKKLSKIETLQEAKERVKLSFRPSEEDPIVRFIGENGKMGLRHLFSEEVVEAPTKNFIDMPVAEVIKPSRWDLNNRDLWEHDEENYKIAKEAAAPLNSKGIFIKKFRYTFPPFNSLFVYSVNNKVGVINMEGKIVLPAEYFSLSIVEWWDEKKCKRMYLTNILRMKKDGKYGYVQLDGKVIVPATLSEYEILAEDEAFETVFKQNPPAQEIPNWGYQYRTYLFDYKENEKIGLKSLKGEKLTEPIYNEIEKQHYCNGKRYFEMKQREDFFHDSYYGLLDEDGKVILPCEYDEDSIDIDPPGLIIARKRGKYGVFDMEGNPIVKCSYVDGCGIQNDSVISAETSKDVTLFNIRGQVIVGKGQYVRIYAYEDGLIYAEDKERTAHYIDLWGNHR